MKLCISEVVLIRGKLYTSEIVYECSCMWVWLYASRVTWVKKRHVGLDDIKYELSPCAHPFGQYLLRIRLAQNPDRLKRILSAVQLTLFLHVIVCSMYCLFSVNLISGKLFIPRCSLFYVAPFMLLLLCRSFFYFLLLSYFFCFFFSNYFFFVHSFL